MIGKHFARVDGNLDNLSETKKYFYHTDYLGSTVLVTDETRKQVWNAEFTPFGKQVSKDGELDHATKFTGKDLDEDTGLYYFNARWYDQEVGRFVSEDPVKDGINWYVYAANNPLIYIDPSGLTIVLSENATPEQIGAYLDAYAQLLEAGRGFELISNLENSETVFTVEFIQTDLANEIANVYLYETNTILWDPNVGLNTNQGVTTPSLMLAHEMGHAEQDLKGDMDAYKAAIKEGQTQEEKYKNLPPQVKDNLIKTNHVSLDKMMKALEEANVQKTENLIADEIGIPTRKTYYDVVGDKTKWWIQTTGSTTNIEKDSERQNTETEEKKKK